MSDQPHPWCTGRAVVALAIIASCLLLPQPADAQVSQSATLTVLRGQVAVVREDGSVVQPAPSGIIVAAIDQIRTLPRSGATIAFFVGTELELGEDTTVILERVSRQGERVDVSIKQAFGVTLHRVQSLADPGSRYEVDIGGAVVVTRGAEFLVYGPTDEHVVGIVCLANCTPETTFAGCPLGPNVAYWTAVERGRVIGACEPFAAPENIWDAPHVPRLPAR